VETGAKHFANYKREHMVTLGSRTTAEQVLRGQNLKGKKAMEATNIAWWLRLMGPRDMASGLTVLSMIASGPPRMVGIIARGAA
jgi:hypothetical protein